MNGDNGHSPNDVLYTASPGSVTDTVNKQATCGAQSYTAFEDPSNVLGTT